MATHGKKAVNTFVFDGVCHIFNFDKKNALGPPNQALQPTPYSLVSLLGDVGESPLPRTWTG